MIGIKDEFDGDTALLLESASALLDLDARGAVVPPLGGHARKIIAAFVCRVSNADLVRTDHSRDPWIQADA